MRILSVAIAAVILASSIGGVAARQSAPQGVRLGDLSWPDAERALTPETVVVIPLDAAAKEHGPHLRLDNDLTMANYLSRRVVETSPVVVAPPLAYHFYPAFIEYPGSTSLNLETARTLTIEVVRSLARSGPRRFYVLNTGVSTSRPLAAAAQALAAEGILLGYTDLGPRLDELSARVRQEEGGTHADEVETSMMLYIDPAAVDMTLTTLRPGALPHARHPAGCVRRGLPEVAGCRSGPVSGGRPGHQAAMSCAWDRRGPAGCRPDIPDVARRPSLRR